jgi:hypothetical protein
MVPGAGEGEGEADRDVKVEEGLYGDDSGALPPLPKRLRSAGTWRRVCGMQGGSDPASCSAEHSLGGQGKGSSS